MRDKGVALWRKCGGGRPSNPFDISFKEGITHVCHESDASPDGFAASRTRIASEGDQGWER